MEFLEKLYEMENFGIYLFVVIGILTVLFFLVLFLGKKDQKNRDLSKKTLETPKEDVSENVAFKEVSVPEEVEVPVVEPQRVEEPVHFEEDKTEEVNTSNVVLNESFELEEEKNEIPVEEKEFDFDALADAISKELETIDIHKEELPKVEEVSTDVKNDDNFQVFESIPLDEAPLIEEPKEEVVETVKPKTVMPTVFSSVYVNREKEEVKPEPLPVVEEKVEPIVPVKPVIELPKMVDLPKRVEPLSEVKPVIEEDKPSDIFPGLSN